MAKKKNNAHPELPVPATPSHSPRKKLKKPSNVKEGQILWNPPVDGAGPSKDHTDHPCLVIGSDGAEKRFKILTITSFGGQSLMGKIPKHQPTRLKYIPIAPTPPHPDTDLVLHLRDGQKLDKLSYVKLSEEHDVAWSGLRRYGNGQTYHLDELSLQFVMESMDLYNKASGSTRPNREYQKMVNQQKLLQTSNNVTTSSLLSLPTSESAIAEESGPFAIHKSDLVPITRQAKAASREGAPLVSSPAPIRFPPSTGLDSTVLWDTINNRPTVPRNTGPRRQALYAPSNQLYTPYIPSQIQQTARSQPYRSLDINERSRLLPTHHSASTPTPAFPSKKIIYIFILVATLFALPAIVQWWRGDPGTMLSWVVEKTAGLKVFAGLRRRVLAL